jgi:SAM-dependent methyltransferase
MNWRWLRPFPWLDTRARFVAATPPGGALLDLGSSDGETLNHIAELRPDLKLHSADKFGHPENYPAHCAFQHCDFVADRLPWPDGSMDAVTCMHVVEHLDALGNLFREVARVLKPGGRAYFETPHPKTVHLPSAKGKFTLNFFDDVTHVRVVAPDELAAAARQAGLGVGRRGISRNWLFAASHPIYCLRAESRKKFTARVHWIGWSAYLVARKPE